MPCVHLVLSPLAFSRETSEALEYRRLLSERPDETLAREHLYGLPLEPTPEALASARKRQTAALALGQLANET